jgi:hypothetical protein
MPNPAAASKTRKATDKAIQLYHDSLAEYRGIRVKHEGALTRRVNWRT